jgi:heme/copper-type cytochrome/quinol oxidase subunit 2
MVGFTQLKKYDIMFIVIYIIGLIMGGVFGMLFGFEVMKEFYEDNTTK